MSALPKPSVPPMPSGIRFATEADEGDLYALLMVLNEDNGFGIPLAPDRIVSTMRRGTRKQGAIIGVIEEDGKIVASVALNISPAWYSDEQHLWEGWLFVLPSVRKSRAHYRTLFRFMEWCRLFMEAETGRKWFVFSSVWSRKKLPLKIRLWARFMRRIGGIFVMGME